LNYGTNTFKKHLLGLYLTSPGGEDGGAEGHEDVEGDGERDEEVLQKSLQKIV